MNIDLIPIGDDPPRTVNVIIEVPVGGEPVKYEFDHKSGALFVDRILHTPMRYPANYGFIPHTLSPDGDPIDALVIARSPFIPGSVVRARVIAVLILEDEQGGDEKLLTVPVDEQGARLMVELIFDRLPADRDLDDDVDGPWRIVADRDEVDVHAARLTACRTVFRSPNGRASPRSAARGCTGPSAG